MNILITGANGFVGRNVKEYFEKNKIYNVFAPNELELDLTDFKNVDKFFVKNSIDCIIHSATVLQVNKEYVSDVCEQNLKMFLICASVNLKILN